MKKLFLDLTILAMVLTATNSFGAGENFLLLRYEAGRDSKTHQDFQKTYTIFENNVIKNWVFGFEFATGNNGFMLVAPRAYYKLNGGFQVGGKYKTDSFNNGFSGISFRFVRPVKKVFVLFDATQYFDIKDDRDTTDIYLNLKTMGSGWYYGMEFWYYSIKNGTENLHFRPIKIGYKFKNDLAPFIMLQRHWNDREDKKDSFLAGVEIKF